MFWANKWWRWWSVTYWLLCSVSAELTRGGQPADSVRQSHYAVAVHRWPDHSRRASAAAADNVPTDHVIHRRGSPQLRRRLLLLQWIRQRIRQLPVVSVNYDRLTAAAYWRCSFIATFLPLSLSLTVPSLSSIIWWLRPRLVFDSTAVRLLNKVTKITVT